MITLRQKYHFPRILKLKILKRHLDPRKVKDFFRKILTKNYVIFFLLNILYFSPYSEHFTHKQNIWFNMFTQQIIVKHNSVNIWVHRCTSEFYLLSGNSKFLNIFSSVNMMIKLLFTLDVFDSKYFLHIST